MSIGFATFGECDPCCEEAPAYICESCILQGPPEVNTTPASWQIVFTGIAVRLGICAQCPSLNGTYVLDQETDAIDDCHWQVNFTAVCNYNRLMLIAQGSDYLVIMWRSGSGTYLTDTQRMHWQLTGLSTHRDCRESGLSLPPTRQGNCANTASTCLITAL